MPTSAVCCSYCLPWSCPCPPDRPRPRPRPSLPKCKWAVQPQATPIHVLPQGAIPGAQ